MNRFLKTAVLSLAVGATTLATLPAAQAGEWRRNHRQHRGDGDLVAAGILGLAVGALAVGALSDPGPRYYDDGPVYVDPPYRPRPVRRYVERRYVEPDVVYANGALDPWTPEWYQYCDSRYRSFNARTGTFTGYDGAQHFCVAN